MIKLYGEIKEKSICIFCLSNGRYNHSYTTTNNLPILKKSRKMIQCIIERLYIFIAYMDEYMKDWRKVRKELNDCRLDYYEAQFRE